MENDSVQSAREFYAKALDKAGDLIDQGYSQPVRKTLRGKLWIALRNSEGNDKLVGPFDEKLYELVKGLVEEGSQQEGNGGERSQNEPPVDVEVIETGAMGPPPPGPPRKPVGRPPAAPAPGGAGDASALFWWREKQGQPLISSLVKKIAWFEDSIHDIGLTALFAIMQVRGVMPLEAVNTFRRFADQKQFENYVIDGLEALLKARMDAEKLLDYEKRIKSLEGMLAYVETLLVLSKKEGEGFRSAFKMAINSMCDEDIRKLFEKKTYADIITATIESPTQIKAAGPEGQ